MSAHTKSNGTKPHGPRPKDSRHGPGSKDYWRRKQAQKDWDKAQKSNFCGAKKKGGGICMLGAGWGTEHFGTGKCKLHGGSTPSHILNAAGDEYRKLFGTPMEINPLDALLWCIKVRAGEVKWLSDRMAELKPEEFIENTMLGKQFHLYARERQKAMADLVKFSQIAISLGIADRAVKLAETYGQLLAAYTQGLLDDLWPYLNEEGRSRAPSFVRNRLLAMDAGTGPQSPTLELTA
jgi:hypothetical protein